MATSPQQLRSRLVELACSGHEFPEFAQRAVELLDSTLSLDAWCVMTADPITLLITGAVGENLPTSDPDNAAEFFRIEYSGEDFINFADLARTGTKVGTLSEATGGDLEKSPRWRALFGPAGLGDQLRIVCADGSACWGYLALHRTKGSENFIEVRREARLGRIPPARGRHSPVPSRRERRRREHSGGARTHPARRRSRTSSGSTPPLSACSTKFFSTRTSSARFPRRSSRSQLSCVDWRVEVKSRRHRKPESRGRQVAG